MGDEGCEGIGKYSPLVILKVLNLPQLSNDPSLSSLPLLTTFLKSYSRPYLGITIPVVSKQSDLETIDGNFPSLMDESVELIEQDIRDKFKRMCEGYYDNVSKKLVIEHKVRPSVLLSQSYVEYPSRDCKNKTAEIMKHILGPVKSSKIANRLMKE